MEKKQNVPALRFPGFSGEWKKKRLEEMGASFSYGLNAAATTYDGQHKYLRITDIDDESRKFSGKELTSPNVDLSNASDYLDYKLQENDIVFARTGASVGKTYLYDTSDGEVYYAGFLIRVKIDSKYDANFIFQKTLTSDYSHFVVVTSQRSGQPGINAQEYANWEMLVPELNEQKKIGRFLTDFDKNIFVCREKIKKLQQFRQAMLAKLFPQDGVGKPELYFEGGLNCWKAFCLEDCAERLDNLRVPVSATNRIAGTTPYYGANGIQDYVSGYTHEGEFILIAEDGANDLDNYPIQYVNGKIWVNNHAHVLQGKTKIADTKFLKYALSQVNMRFYLVGGSRSKLNSNIMMNIELKLPIDINEQRKIGDFLGNLDRYISLQQKKLERMQRLKAALLEKLFV